MKYGLLLKILHLLVVVKRSFWWLGSGLYFVLSKIIRQSYVGGAYLSYKVNYWLKRLGLSRGGGWFWRRGTIQTIVFLVLVFVAVPQTKLYAQKGAYLPGQKTIAFSILGPEEDYSLEEIAMSNTSEPYDSTPPAWKAGAVETDGGSVAVGDFWPTQELAGVVAGGTAVSQPLIMPGATVGGQRSAVIDYAIEPGDSLGGIAYQFGLNVTTLLWANNLGAKSILRPGDVIKIPPTDGVIHTIKKGDTLQKLANLYGVRAADVVKFNKLKEDGTDLVIGERIMIPNGVRPQTVVVRPAAAIVNRIAAPPSSRQQPSVGGFVWPTAARVITQYFNWGHHALDIAGGNKSTPIYAAKAGTVVTSQCGWNSGYGCYIIIDHGGGVRTLYGHNSRLLVSAGEHVETGQTISLMGNTGKVRGVTGIHLHFEIHINGRRVNPLGYVR